MAAKDRKAKREARKWAKAEKDALKGRADIAHVAALRPKQQEKRTEEGGSSG